MNFLADLPDTTRISLDAVLSPYVYVFYAAYIVSFLFTPVMRHIAVYFNIVDEPDGIRKMHRVPVAYLGGVAVFLGWLAGLAISHFLSLHDIRESVQLRQPVMNFGIVMGGCSIVILGLWDDIMHMSPWKKIMGQVFAAGCLLLGGIGKRATVMFFEPIFLRTNKLGWSAFDLPNLDQHWFIIYTSYIFVILIVVGCCNATNLMDGLDGLCGGVTAVVAAGFLFLAAHLATYVRPLNVNMDAIRVILGLALLGGVLGFVPYNFNPASIFMGDTGSMFLGYCCATMMILFASENSTGNPKWFLASMVMFALPLLDTTLAFVRRYVNGRPLFSADRFHIHHQLVARGYTVKRTVVIAYSLSLFFVLLGSAVVFVRTRYAVGIYLVVFGSIIVAAYKMGMVHERVKPVAAKPLGESDSGQIDTAIEPSTVLEVNPVQPPEKSA